jgi:hypothetical protein
VFQVELDGESQRVDSFSAVDNTCKVGYKKENLLDKQHDMVVTTLGPSPQAPRADSGGTVNIENIMYVFCLLCVGLRFEFVCFAESQRKTCSLYFLWPCLSSSIGIISLSCLRGWFGL